MSPSAPPRTNDHQTYQLLYVAKLDLSQAAFFADHIASKGMHLEPWEGNWRTYMHQCAYMTAMVMAYARPFTESRGWPKFPQRLLDLSPEQRSLHKRMLSLRNEVYAHANIEGKYVQPINFEGKPTAVISLPPMRLSAEEVWALREIIRTVSTQIQRRLGELLPRIARQT